MKRLLLLSAIILSAVNSSTSYCAQASDDKLMVINTLCGPLGERWENNESASPMASQAERVKYIPPVQIRITRNTTGADVRAFVQEQLPHLSLWQIRLVLTGSNGHQLIEDDTRVGDIILDDRGTEWRISFILVLKSTAEEKESAETTNK